jgi:transcriptional regulator with XRE-family HTH domain
LAKTSIIFDILAFYDNFTTFAVNMEKILAENVKRLCKQQGKQLKDLACEMNIDASSLTRAMYGNARLDTIEKIAGALGVSVSSLFESVNDESIEGFIKIRGKIYQFNSKEELLNIIK